jgi:DnaJ-class molecular chaperone
MNNNGGPMANFPFPPPSAQPKQEPVKNEQELTEESGDESDYIYSKTRDICFDLNVDLEDFYTGKKKKLNVKRKRMVVGPDGKQIVVEEKKKLIIPIEKGMKDEQTIRFEGEADQIPGYKAGDIIITLIENEHPVFQRDNDNLIMIKNINLYQSYDFTFDIKHLDGRIIRITKDPSDALHLNESLRKIPGEGMPKYKTNGEYGDLFIRFNIVIPKTLEPSKMSILKDIFNVEVIDEGGIFIKNSEEVNKKYVLENVSDTDIEELDSESDSEDYSESDSVSSDSVSESNSETSSRPKKSKRT